MSSIIDSIERRQLKANIPTFGPGDRVRVHFQVIEGSRRRTQVFEGVVLKRQGNGARETFTVRKQSFGVGVERTFPLHSPKIERLEVAARGDVRRAKLYYLRGRVGKRARVSERRWGIDDEVLATPPEEADAVDAEGVSQSEAEVVERPEEEEGEEQAAEAGDEGAEAEAEAPLPEAEEAEPEQPEEDEEPEQSGESEESEQPEGEKDES
jgi:large subunit ribosomal protein L19